MPFKVVQFNFPLVFCLSAALASGQTQSVLTIREAVTEAVQNNPGLIAERLGIPVADAARITAALKPNPVLSFSGDHLDMLGTGFNEVNGAGTSEFAARVDLPWERGHKRELRMEAAAYPRQILEAKVADSVRRLSLDVTLACIDLLEAKTRLDLANDNLKALEGIVGLNETRVKGGAIAPIELTRSRVAMLQFRTSIKNAELAVMSARAKLQTLLGRTPGGVIDISGGLKVPVAPQPPDLAKIEATAIDARSDLKAIVLDQARSQADLKLQLAQSKVDYTYGTEYRRQQGINGTGNSLGFFFSAPLPVYNKNQGEIARATAEQEQIKRAFIAQRAQVISEVLSAANDFESARAVVTEIEQDLLAPSQEARDTTAYIYRAGASSLMEVLDAQRAFNETMSAYYGAQADYRRAASRLAAASAQEGIQ